MHWLSEPTLVDKVSEPVLWHTDLHMGNIYVANGNPTKITSLIDWQSVIISSLFLQARLPEFLPVGEDYVFGARELPKLPQDYDDLDVYDKEYAECKLKEAKLAKAYELTRGSVNNQAYKALQLPSVLREFFVRSGEVSEEGVIPLRACLIEISKVWHGLGFTDPCPIIFSKSDLRIHKQQFEEYRDFHRVHELARDILGTDVEGWIAPQVNFGTKQKHNEELLHDIMHRSHEYNKSPADIQRIWPYVEGA